MTMGTMPRLVASSALMLGVLREGKLQTSNVGFDYVATRGAPQKNEGHRARRRGAPFHEHAFQPAISSSKGSAFSVTLAFDKTKSATLFSMTTASTSAMRWRSPRYQRTTSAGFS